MPADFVADLTTRELETLERNATGLLGSPRNDAAADILVKIAEERTRRAATAALDNKRHADSIRERMRDKGLWERTIVAFTERPPLEWEAAMIGVLLGHPGASTEELSHAGGYKGTYMNWFGHVCRDREPWLGAAGPTARSGSQIIYSSLLVDFKPFSDATTGRTSTAWYLKTEAREAFEYLGIPPTRES